MTLLSVPPLDDPPYPSLGGQVCDFIEERAVFGPGSLKGQPAKLDDEKRAIIWRAYEVFPRGHRRAGRRRFQRVGISLPKGSSKALALDTPLATVSGWTTMGDVKVGDALFDERGEPCRVIGVSDVFLGSRCFEVIFRDGSRITADADHRWYTEELRHEYRGSVKTTVELASSVSPRSDGARNHRIPVAKPLVLPEVDLPIDPWILGAWLGDGRTDDAEFTMHADDHPHFLERVAAAGYFTAAPKVDSRNGVFAVRVSTTPVVKRKPIGTDTLKGRLRANGLLGNKHVPAVYLRAGYGQRLALLQGLMDTDGSLDARGNSGTFVSTVEALARDTYELACSLGLKPTMCGPRDTGAKPAWVVYFHPRGDVDVFSLPRKRERQHAVPPRTAMCTNRHVVEVREVPSVPTRCVAVDSPSRLYLAGRSMIPTHNTELLAWVAFTELHAEGPVRFDGWDTNGQPVGRPVPDPYIPLVGVSEEQTEELAYGALVIVCTEGPDADLFDVSLERIIRLGPSGRADGKATALAAAPNSRDGARTTFEGWDETHRLYLPRVRDARATMLANLTKRPLDEPWDMAVTTAGQLGQGSIAEDMHAEADAVVRGEYVDPDLYYHHRQAGDGHDLATLEGRTAAVAEARGGVGEYAPGQFEDIARMWDRPKADKPYLERVWLNRWVRADAQAFDVKAWQANLRPAVADGELVVAGFDGARFRDSTAIVLTDVASGAQWIHAIWERPLDLPEDAGWEIPASQVDEAVDEVFRRYQCWAFWGDPPHWVDSFANWAARHPDQGKNGVGVEEWWTNRTKAMAYAVRDYVEAIGSGEVGPAAMEQDRVDRLARHVAGAGRNLVNYWHDDGSQLCILRKLHPDRKFDAAMAAVISWQARLEAVRKGARKRVRAIPSRIR